MLELGALQPEVLRVCARPLSAWAIDWPIVLIVLALLCQNYEHDWFLHLHGPTHHAPGPYVSTSATTSSSTRSTVMRELKSRDGCPITRCNAALSAWTKLIMGSARMKAGLSHIHRATLASFVPTHANPIFLLWMGGARRLCRSSSTMPSLRGQDVKAIYM